MIHFSGKTQHFTNIPRTSTLLLFLGLTENLKHETMEANEPMFSAEENLSCSFWKFSNQQLALWPSETSCIFQFTFLIDCIFS